MRRVAGRREGTRKGGGEKRMFPIFKISSGFVVRIRKWPRHFSMELFTPRSMRLIRFMPMAVAVTYSGS
ncbi:hypothetical protein L2E82_02440 [Cichorium intybus]|uniref:Uncharacterized protein n=1 Tax=Cichorium intybus TaxID=13427 RepID=A0ACB9H1A2_CICIN|nr:hypothetical protein L2E82_02440 [Cichorium intybus]